MNDLNKRINEWKENEWIGEWKDIWMNKKCMNDRIKRYVDEWRMTEWIYEWIKERSEWKNEGWLEWVKEYMKEWNK